MIHSSSGFDAAALPNKTKQKKIKEGTFGKKEKRNKKKMIHTKNNKLFIIVIFLSVFYCRISKEKNAFEICEAIKKKIRFDFSCFLP